VDEVAEPIGEIDQEAGWEGGHDSFTNAGARASGVSRRPPA
jgi:hypothetical protein